MDNKKAIDLLSMIEFEHAECCLNTWYKGIDDDMKEALKMAINALECEPFMNKPCVANQICHEDKIKMLDKLKSYVDHIRNTGMGKKKSLEFIEKFIEGLKGESDDK